MAYTITYKFGSSLDVGEAVAGEHLIRMSIAFTVQDTASNVEKFARDYGIHVASYGELSWERNIDENFMVPGQFNFSLLDTAEELWALLFEGPLVPKVEKDGIVTLEINYWNGSSFDGYQTEFIGNIDNTNLVYDKSNNKLSILAIPKTDILKGIYLYDEVPNKPGVLSGNNPLTLSYTNTSDVYIATATNFKTVIHEIFKKINPACTLEWQHSWLFRGEKFGVGTYDYFTLEDSKLTSNFLSCLFFSTDNQMRVDTLYDLLMKFSFAFGFITGMITSAKAFVKELYVYDSGNTQTMGIAKKHIVGSKYGDLEAVRITSRLYTRSASGGKNAFYEKTSRVASIPVGSQIRGGNNIDDEIIAWLHPYDGINDNTLIGQYALNDYQIQYAKPSNVSYYKVLEEAIANFYYNLRSRKKYNPTGSTTNVIGREDEFVFENIKYDYLKDFAYAGNGYQILTLKKKIGENESNIRALLVEDTIEDNGADTGDGYPRPFTNVLPGGYLKSYEYNAEIDTDDANAGGGIIYSVMAGTLVKRITMLFIAGFNNISAVTITDNDGTLKESKEIIWDTDGAKMEIILFKEYATGQDIMINFTKTGTVTTGEIDCIVEISRKD